MSYFVMRDSECKIDIFFTVAERVFELYTTEGLKYKGTSLELELEIPWLTKQHDDHKIRISGLDKDLDPEMLKFYLSAISDNIVTDMFFNQNHSRAVVIFKNTIGRLLLSFFISYKMSVTTYFCMGYLFIVNHCSRLWKTS